MDIISVPTTFYFIFSKLASRQDQLANEYMRTEADFNLLLMQLSLNKTLKCCYLHRVEPCQVSFSLASLTEVLLKILHVNIENNWAFLTS